MSKSGFFGGKRRKVKIPHFPSSKSLTFLLQNPSLSFFTHTPLSFFKIPPLTNDERRTTKIPTLIPFFSSPHHFFSVTKTHDEETHIIADEFLIFLFSFLFPPFISSPRYIDGFVKHIVGYVMKHFELGNQGQGRFHGYGRKLREKENEKLTSFLLGLLSMVIILIMKDHFVVIYTSSVAIGAMLARCINLCSYYVFGLPLGYLLGYTKHFGEVRTVGRHDLWTFSPIQLLITLYKTNRTHEVSWRVRITIDVL
uniref:Uncharacterized protein n=1 Tax=Cucumis melo TaxID=3656 RepID=A0A9I9EIB2_CUCME